MLAISADLTQAEDVERVARDVAEAFGRIDILINCAGSAMGGPFLELNDDAFLNAWTLKLLGYIRMTRAVVPAMIARRDGRIVNIVGGAGRFPSPVFLTGSTGQRRADQLHARPLERTRGAQRSHQRDFARNHADGTLRPPSRG